MSRWIAERTLIAELVETGDWKAFTLRVGIPFWPRDGESASCPIEFDGHFDHVADSRGIDLVQALQLASDVDSMLGRLREKYSFYWSSGEPYFDAAPATGG